MELCRLPLRTANAFYRKYEHLGNCGLGVWHYGLYYNGELLSVVSYGTTCFNKNKGELGGIAAKHDLKVIQLARGGTKFDAPSNIPSIIIKKSLKEIRRQFGNCIVIAYSDIKWNEIGTIYQACNFNYLGLTNPGGQSNYIIEGKFMSGWDVRKIYGTRSVEKLKLRGINVERIPLSPKHRYIFINAAPLKKKFVKRNLYELVKPYPKREALNVGSMIEIRTELKLG